MPAIHAHNSHNHAGKYMHVTLSRVGTNHQLLRWDKSGCFDYCACIYLQIYMYYLRREIITATGSKHARAALPSRKTHVFVRCSRHDENVRASKTAIPRHGTDDTARRSDWNCSHRARAAAAAAESRSCAVLIAPGVCQRCGCVLLMWSESSRSPLSVALSLSVTMRFTTPFKCASWSLGSM